MEFLVVGIVFVAIIGYIIWSSKNTPNEVRAKVEQTVAKPIPPAPVLTQTVVAKPVAPVASVSKKPAPKKPQTKTPVKSKPANTAKKPVKKPTAPKKTK